MWVLSRAAAVSPLPLQPLARGSGNAAALEFITCKQKRNLHDVASLIAWAAMLEKLARLTNWQLDDCNHTRSCTSTATARLPFKCASNVEDLPLAARSMLSFLNVAHSAKINMKIKD